MPITRTPCRKVSAYCAGEWVDDFDCREDIEDFVWSAAESYSVTGHRGLCALGEFDEYRRTEPIMFFVVITDRSAAYLSWNDQTAAGSLIPQSNEGLWTIWDGDHPQQLDAEEFGLDVETLHTAVFEYVGTGLKPTCVTWQSNNA